MVCHSLLQWTTFCQTSPPWPVRLGWPHMAWLSFIELDKAVVHVIRLASCLWLWFQSVCPLMPAVSAYQLTWVSLTLDVGYLFMAAPAKHSCCSWFSKPGFRNTWTMNFQIFKLVLEKAEEPEIKLPTSAGSSKKQESPEKHLLLLYWLCQSLCLCGSQYQWEILKEMGISDHLACLLRNLYADQEVTVRTGHGATDCFQIGEGVCQGCITSLCLFNFYAEYIQQHTWEMLGLMKHRLESRLLGKYQ